MRCEEIQNSLGLFALGALSAADSAAIEVHLADCGACAAERRDLAQVAELLPWATPQVAPPTAIEGRLRTGTTPTHAVGRVVPFPDWTRRRSWMPAAAAAMVILSLGMTGAAGLFYAHGQSTDAQLQAARQDASLSRRALAALSGGSGRTIALHPAHTGSGASGIFRLDAQSGQVVLVVQGLPSAPPGRAYQAWMHLGSERFSIGTFTAATAGAPVVLAAGAQSPALLTQIDGFGITLEPSGGSPHPTRPPLLIG